MDYHHMTFPTNESELLTAFVRARITVLYECYSRIDLGLRDLRAFSEGYATKRGIPAPRIDWDNYRVFDDDDDDEEEKDRG